MVKWYHEYEPKAELQLTKNLNGPLDMYHFVAKYESLGHYHERNSTNPGAEVVNAWKEAITKKNGEGEFRDMQENFYHITEI